MRVLYIGHYKEFGGWSQAATDQILALDKAGVDVVCRNVTLTSDKSDVHPRILELEKKDSSECDFCIQHVLPHHLVGTSAFKKNIAFLEVESYSIKTIGWFEQLQQMDEIWVPNKTLMKSLEQDSIGVPLRLVHHATDVNKYKKKYKDIHLPNIDDTFKFYYVGDLNDRKNIASIVTCFHSEFDRAEDVSLVIKVNKFGKTPEQTHAELEQILTREKQLLRLYNSIEKYKKEGVLSVRLSEEELYSVHQYCDCFVLPSHGEAWSIPSLDAVGFGNTPICSDFGGPSEFIDPEDKNTGSLVNGVFSCCKCSNAAFPDMFTGREYWFQPCEKTIRENMRSYYESYKENPIAHRQRAKSAGLSVVENFSYQKIGERMLEVLNES